MRLWWLVIVALAGPAVAAPPAAEPYRRAVTREMRLQFGLDAPVALMAAQIEQESAWNPLAQSPYAQGLAQFTPSTAAWISGAYPATLSLNQPFEHVELHTNRSPEAARENRGYPRRILLKLQANYLTWGRAVTC